MGTAAPRNNVESSARPGALRVVALADVESRPRALRSAPTTLLLALLLIASAPAAPVIADELAAPSGPIEQRGHVADEPDAARTVTAMRDAFAAYESGRIPDAQSLYLRAAEAGNSAAAYNAAVIRINGESEQPSIEEALRLLQVSAEAGFVTAQLMVATLHEQGRLLPVSLPLAMEWYRRAAAQGSPDAQLALATAYYVGRPVAQDDREAARWYTLAADGGDATAQYILASMYEKGVGVDEDLQQALTWYAAVARQGDVAADLKAKEMAQRLTGDRAR